MSAFEIHTSRDLHTGENPSLNDRDLRRGQLQERNVVNSKTGSPATEVFIGDTVIVHNKNQKHKAKDIFLVTAKDGEKIDVQKILHPLTGSGKFMSKVYKTDQKRLKPIYRS